MLPKPPHLTFELMHDNIAEVNQVYQSLLQSFYGGNFACSYWLASI